ncbi:MAG: hypothetical protein JJE39_14530 [Vicinamibacteria bacterium]|nr:hypothetical protein [Vicinamibacteria bacterium]
MKPGPQTSEARISDLDAVEKGILWPVVYASIFGAPIQSSRLWEQTVGVRVTQEEVWAAMASLISRGLLVERDGEIWLHGSASADAFAVFGRRKRATQDLLDRHLDILNYVKSLPGVRLAALSGGCAHGAAVDGDIDIFAITEPGALWRTLLRVMLVAKIRGWRRILCMNYLVDATALALPWRDFYSGLELISLRPFKGAHVFGDLLRENLWIDPIFPNFLQSRPNRQNPGNQTSTVSGGRLLEATAKMIQQPYLRKRLPPGTGVELSNHVIRLHATDHRPRLRGLFQEALQNIGLEAPAWI